MTKPIRRMPHGKTKQFGTGGDVLAAILWIGGQAFVLYLMWHGFFIRWR